MPWMSRLLGPPSETINSVSERASAFAADQIAGAGTMAPAATPVTDFRKSRRFMRALQRTTGTGLEMASQGSCQIGTDLRSGIKCLSEKGYLTAGGDSPPAPVA